VLLGELAREDERPEPLVEPGVRVLVMVGRESSCGEVLEAPGESVLGDADVPRGVDGRWRLGEAVHLVWHES